MYVHNTCIPYALFNGHVETFMKGSFDALKLDFFIFLFFFLNEIKIIYEEETQMLTMYNFYLFDALA